MREEGQQN